MRTSFQLSAVLLLLGCSLTFAAGDDYYQGFLAARGTNVMLAQWISSPTLIDTNNATCKQTNLLADLKQSKGHGELAGIRIGMTMEEVVATWGKPMRLYSRCFGGPRLFYSDASVIFDSATNSVRTVWLDMMDHSRKNHGPAYELSLEDCIRVLGEPTLRIGQNGSNLELVYRRPLETLKLSIFAGRLSHVRAEGTPLDAQSR